MFVNSKMTEQEGLVMQILQACCHTSKHTASKKIRLNPDIVSFRHEDKIECLNPQFIVLPDFPLPLVPL